MRLFCRAVGGRVAFRELHTHLMGMGSSRFWVYYILGWYIPHRLKQILPEEFDSARGNLGEIVYDHCWRAGELDILYRDIFRKRPGLSEDESASIEKFIEDMNTKFSSVDLCATKYHDVIKVSDLSRNTLPHFPQRKDLDVWRTNVKGRQARETSVHTAGIVISVESLAVAFDLHPSMHPMTKENYVQSHLHLDPLHATSEREASEINKDTFPLLKHYFVWNARKQELQTVRGWPAMHVRRVLGLDLPRHHDFDCYLVVRLPVGTILLLIKSLTEFFPIVMKLSQISTHDSHPV